MDTKRLVPGSKVKIIKEGSMYSDTFVGDIGITCTYPSSALNPNVEVLVNGIKWWIEIDALKVLKYGTQNV